MKLQLFKQLFALTIALMVFSILPATVCAQHASSELGQGIVLSEPVINSAEDSLDLSTTDAQSFASRRCRSDADCGRYRRCFNGECILWGGGWPIAGDLANDDTTDSASIEYWLPSDGIVSISLYDGTGQLIRSLVDEWMPSGDHELAWNAKDAIGNTLHPGIYLVTLQTGDVRETTRVIAF